MYNRAVPIFDGECPIFRHSDVPTPIYSDSMGLVRPPGPHGQGAVLCPQTNGMPQSEYYKLPPAISAHIYRLPNGQDTALYGMLLHAIY